MKTALKTFAALLIAAIAYLLFWPVPIAPVALHYAPAPGYTAEHAPNTRLAKMEMIDLGGERGPEHVVIGPDGKLYTGVESGNILRMQPDGNKLDVLVNTGGRPLGLDFDTAGNLIAADAVKGLLSITKSGAITVLTDKVSDAASDASIRYADAVIVAKDGKIYFSDASTRFNPKDWGGVFESSVMDMMEGSATGRILVYDPSDKSTRIVARGLNFANGVALSADQQTLFVNETGRFRVWKIAAAARGLDLSQDAVPPQASVLLDNLPGYPDNLMRGADGKIWLGLAAPRSPDADQIADKPFLRKIVMRLPRALWPVPKTYGHVMAFTEDGKIVADLQDPTGVYPATTAVTETKDRLYVQSLNAYALGWLPHGH